MNYKPSRLTLLGGFLFLYIAIPSFGAGWLSSLFFTDAGDGTELLYIGGVAFVGTIVSWIIDIGIDIYKGNI